MDRDHNEQRDVEEHRAGHEGPGRGGHPKIEFARRPEELGAVEEAHDPRHEHQDQGEDDETRRPEKRQRLHGPREEPLRVEDVALELRQRAQKLPQRPSPLSILPAPLLAKLDRVEPALLDETVVRHRVDEPFDDIGLDACALGEGKLLTHLPW